MTAPSPSAAPLTPLPEYVEEAISEVVECTANLGNCPGDPECTEPCLPNYTAAVDALRAALRRHAEEAARGAGEHDDEWFAATMEDRARRWLVADGFFTARQTIQLCGAELALILQRFGFLTDDARRALVGAAPSAPDPRPAGCGCPVERVVKVLKTCTKHGERKP